MKYFKEMQIHYLEERDLYLWNPSPGRSNFKKCHSRNFKLVHKLLSINFLTILFILKVIPGPNIVLIPSSHGPK